jgi:glucose-6-phosphate isomerase
MESPQGPRGADEDRFAARTLRRGPGARRAFSLEVGGWYLDYSKNLATAETMRLLQALCPMADLRGEIDAMFSGRKINETENRPVLHVALRNRSNAPILVDRKDVMPAVNAVLEKMSGFADLVRAGKWRGSRASPSATSSTSASAAAISVPSWPMKP